MRDYQIRFGRRDERKFIAKYFEAIRAEKSSYEAAMEVVDAFGDDPSVWIVIADIQWRMDDVTALAKEKLSQVCNEFAKRPLEVTVGWRPSYLERMRHRFQATGVTEYSKVLEETLRERRAVTIDPGTVFRLTYRDQDRPKAIQYTSEGQRSSVFRVLFMDSFGDVERALQEDGRVIRVPGFLPSVLKAKNVERIGDFEVLERLRGVPADVTWKTKPSLVTDPDRDAFRIELWQAYHPTLDVDELPNGAIPINLVESLRGKDRPADFFRGKWGI